MELNIPQAILDPRLLLLVIPCAFLLFMTFYIVMRIYAGQFIKWEQPMRDASRELGFNFTNAFLAGDSAMHDYSNLSAHKTEYIFRAMRFSLKIKNIRMDGIYKGVNVSIFFEEDDDYNEHMVLRARFPTSLSMGLLIEPVNPALNLFRKLKSKTTSAPFDLKDHVRITVSDPDLHRKQIQAALDSEPVQRLYRAFPRTVIGDETITCTRSLIMNYDTPPNFKNIIKIIASALKMIRTCMST